MPFQTSVIKERILKAQAEERLAHAYLLTGPSMQELETLFYDLAHSLLKINKASSLLIEEEKDIRPFSHADLHVIKPESKSRRLKVEQIRKLEHALQLHAHDAPVKVAGIFAADRMCLPPAEAANAFLKTLEEPPDHTIIFLLTDRPTALLPTIISRCLNLAVIDTHDPQQEELWTPDFLTSWLQNESHHPDTAYRYASQLSKRWQQLREDIAAKLKQAYASSSTNDPLESEDVQIAQIESDFLLARDQSIASLIRGIWKHAELLGEYTAAAPICETLEDLRLALNRNIDQDLALERACLVIFGQIHAINDKAKTN
ncbi:MAG: hypothetical protein AAGA18_10995 [Verrucomicrobiota bacterium]